MREENVGLTTHEAKLKLAEFGPNILPEKPPPSGLSIFLSQLKSPLVYILIFAGIITLFIREYTDAVVIGLAVFVNTVLGFFQERRAENALYALKKLINPKAEVIRDGKRKTLSVEEIVPGDICIINSGDKVPADGKIIKANRLFLTEAILTGESVAVSKSVGNIAFMGTIVTSGEGRLLVEKTGKDTEIGKIATSIQKPSEDTPLTKQLKQFSRHLTTLVVILTLFVFTTGVFTGRDLFEIFETSVALAVSAIPEGLLIGMTVVLAIGMQKVLKRQGLVRNLVSAETLGGVTTICVDKTGTLTQGKMQVVDVIGSEIDIAKQSIIANDLDDPIVIATWEWANKKLSAKDLKGAGVDDYLAKHARIDSIPFSSKDRYFACLNKINPQQKILFVNGAPEFLLEWSNIQRTKKAEIKKEIDKLTSEGKRVVGLCKKKVPFTKNKISENDVKNNLEWVGLIGLTDPLREGVSEALKKAVQAKVKLVVITGDYAQTAVSVLSQLGIKVMQEDIVLGSELTKMPEEALGQRLKSGGFKLFARTTPHQKLKIVESLKVIGEVVAMMGDGVNDAPALKRADIGIVVGDASDVAKESADLVLLDSSFSTIIASIEEGRGIFDNIRKIVLYLISGAFGEITAVIGSIILSILVLPGLPLPLAATQILWINLVTDSFPHLALSVDPKRKNIMNAGPRSPNEPLVSGWMKKLIMIVSLTAGLMALAVFVVYYKITSDLVLAQSLAFAVLGMSSLFYVYSTRALEDSFLSARPLENKWLNTAVLGGIILQITPFLFPAGRNFLHLTELGIKEWSIVFLLSTLLFFIIEISKHIFKNSLRRDSL